VARIVARAPEREEQYDMVKESPVVRIANAIISQAINEDADLIHIEPMALGVRVRYRIDRQLRDIMRLPSDLYAPLIARIKSLLCVGDDPSSRLGRALVKYGDREIDLTLSAYPTSRGERLVMRLTPHTDL
jgi:type II secretory ATPase GspE/PulE/Tfp pilus assembly ATPase PilB-like protein